MSISRARIIANLVLLLIVASCGGWGAAGHKTVSHIAYAHLTPKAKAEVDKLLAGETLAEFSVWPDLIKGDKAWTWTRPWHYVNIPGDADGFSMERDCPKGECVVQGIIRYSGDLKDAGKSQEDRSNALKFLAHYVGDLHQPLHAGRAEDKGGNDLKVQLYSRGANLHQVWDDGLIRRRGMEPDVYARKLEAKLTPEAFAASVTSMDPVAWATESFKLARDVAYKHPDGTQVKDGDTLGEPYAAAMEKVVDEQLMKAGLRLAAMLNNIYDPGTATPQTGTPIEAVPPARPSRPAPPETPAAAPSGETKFVGSKRSEVYHYLGCADAKTIKPENLVEYAAAPEGKRLHQGCPR